MAKCKARYRVGYRARYKTRLPPRMESIDGAIAFVEAHLPPHIKRHRHDEIGLLVFELVSNALEHGLLGLNKTLLFAHANGHHKGGFFTPHTFFTPHSPLYIDVSLTLYPHGAKLSLCYPHSFGLARAKRALCGALGGRGGRILTLFGIKSTRTCRKVFYTTPHPLLIRETHFIPYRLTR